MNVHEAHKQHEQVEIYVKETYNGSASTPQQMQRLHEVVDILAQHGITEPIESDFENILRPAIAAKGKKQGQQAKEKTITDRLRLARGFYNWIKSKGENEMNGNEIRTTEELEQLEAIKLSAYQEAKNEPRKVGRPVATGRNEKVSLYLTKETKKQLEALRTYDDTDMQDLINEAIQVYFKTREDDMNFLRAQEEARRARKANRNAL